MPRGGARNRSGPQPDPDSGRSERRGLTLSALPAEGYTGDAPDYPLPDPEARELELWAWLWRTPQAAAWIRDSWRWHAVAMWCRTAMICEYPGATAADKTILTRIADQIGMTPAGLKENGWKIAADEVTGRRTSGPADPVVEEDDVRARLTVVSDAG